MQTTVPPRRHLNALASLLAIAAVPATGAATPSQGGGSACQPDWQATFGTKAGLSLLSQSSSGWDPPGKAAAMAVYDDGTGPGLIVGGTFAWAGNVPAKQVARWDGQNWSAVVPPNLSLPGIQALEVFDDGGGAALFAGGSFAAWTPSETLIGIARWDGHAWTGVGSGLDRVDSLAVFDDGSGPALYAGGSFQQAGGAPASNIARWDGNAWSSLGGGVQGGSVFALHTFDGDSGAVLVAGGNFTGAGGVPGTRGIARWDGQSWSALGGGVDGQVLAFATVEHGGSQALFAGGAFFAAGGAPARSIARWDGNAWRALGAGVEGAVYALGSVPGADPPVVVAGGWFSAAGGAATANLAYWDGTTWNSGGDGTQEPVRALVTADLAGGPELYVGGEFDSVDGVPARSLAVLDGAGWTSLGQVGLDQQVRVLHVHDDGTGPATYVGGYFQQAAGVLSNRIGRWDGAQWHALGGGVTGAVQGVPHVAALASAPAGAPPALYAGGNFQQAGGVPAANVARWDGANWQALGAGLTGGVGGEPVMALAFCDIGSGSQLYAGGRFLVSGATPVERLARWDGQAWLPVAADVTGVVHALAAWDDGTGTALYVGGALNSLNGVPIRGLARWDGLEFTALGGGIESVHPFLPVSVSALAALEGSGVAGLYVGGTNLEVAGQAAGMLARWDGSAWSALPGVAHLAETVFALAAAPGPDGDQLYAGGSFKTVNGLEVNHVARWDGSTWSALNAGTNGTVRALVHVDGSQGSELLVGGAFLGQPGRDDYLARWTCPPSVAVVPGCYGNPAALTALTSHAVIGQAFGLALAAGAYPEGVALLYAGLANLSPQGCGLPLPGIGEWMLMPEPFKFFLGYLPMAGGQSGATLPVPDAPAILGLSLLFQAGIVGFLPGFPLELSNGLSLTFVP